MQQLPNYDLFRNPRPRDTRLINEHRALHAICERSEMISYEIPDDEEYPPEQYRLTYKVKSMVGIDDQKMPIYGYEHRVLIGFPPEFPGGGNLIVRMETPVWHPNIRWSGSIKGKICIDEKAIKVWMDLGQLAIRIGEILQWKNYLAENKPPYPEDEFVASWVRDFAEPNNIVNYRTKKVVDERELLLPEPGHQSERKLPKPPEPPPSKIVFTKIENVVPQPISPTTNSRIEIKLR